jgi:hypothetical protein
MIIDFQAQKLRALVNRLQTIGEIYFLKKKVGTAQLPYPALEEIY